MSDTKALYLAVLFHVIYERKSAEFNYTTRKETRIFDPESPNGKLMIATCEEILQDYVPAAALARAWEIINSYAEYHETNIDEIPMQAEGIKWLCDYENGHPEERQLRADLDEAIRVMEPFAKWLSTKYGCTTFGEEPTTGDVIYAQAFLARMKEKK